MARPRGPPQQLQGTPPGRHPNPRLPASGPLHVHDPHVPQPLHPLHHTLPRTNRLLVAPWHLLPPPRRLQPPPPRAAQAPTRTLRRTILTTATSRARWGTSPRTCCSPSSAATRALAGRCTALPNGPHGVEGHPPSPAEGGPPEPPIPQRPITMCLCPFMVAVRLMKSALPRSTQPHPTLSPPYRREHGRQIAVLLLNPRLPPAVTFTHPGAGVYLPLVTHRPAHPRQLHNATTHHT